LDEDIPKFADSYTLQEYETERGKLKVEREQEFVDGTIVRIIIIIML
jgi:hypothetical protein